MLLDKSLQQPQGLVLVTGSPPVVKNGHALYSALQTRNTGINLMLEDPIEITGWD